MSRPERLLIAHMRFATLRFSVYMARGYAELDLRKTLGYGARS